MTRVGAITASLYLPEGYLLADGSTKNRADYPRLINLINKYNLWTEDTINDLGKYGKGDNNTTFILPNLIDRHIKYASSAGEKLEAGLPNLKGMFDFVYGDEGYGSSGVHVRTSTNLKENNTLFYQYGDTWARNVNITDGGGPGAPSGIMFDAENFNSIYGKSDTVQPSSIKFLPIIRY